jgi:hypothetical protein
MPLIIKRAAETNDSQFTAQPLYVASPSRKQWQNTGVQSAHAAAAHGAAHTTSPTINRMVTHAHRRSMEIRLVHTNSANRIIRNPINTHLNRAGQQVERELAELTARRTLRTLAANQRQGNRQSGDVVVPSNLVSNTITCACHTTNPEQVHPKPAWVVPTKPRPC